jgi:hypothetical protein
MNGYSAEFEPAWSKTRTRCFSRIYLKASVLPSHVSLPTSIPDISHQKERHHQGKGNEFLMPLAGQEAVGRYCQLQSDWADFLPRARNLNAEQSMSYEFVSCLIFIQIHLT